MIGPIELVVAAFNEQGKAKEVLAQLEDLQKQEILFLVNAAVMVKDEDGKVRLKETQDVSGGKGAAFGAVIGGVVGLLGGPLGVALGASVGAAAGGLAAKKIDMGFPDDTLAELSESLKPNSSAIVALIQHQWVDQVVKELEKQNAALFRQALKEEISAQLEAGDVDRLAEPPKED